MAKLQSSVVNLPAGLGLLREGRYLVCRQNAGLLNRVTYAGVKDVSCFLFNDGLMLAYRIIKHMPFTK